MARAKSNPSKNATANLGFEAGVPVRMDPAADTAMRMHANRNCAATWRDLRAAKDYHRLGELIATISLLGWDASPQASADGSESRPNLLPHRSVDLPGCVHECFLTRFASAEDKNGGEAKCEARSASVEVNTVRPFVICHFPWPRLRFQRPARPVGHICGIPRRQTSLQF